MEIILSNTSSENNRLDKVLIDSVTKVGTCRDVINVTNPIVTVKGYIKDYNYCHIPSFGRYYFIDSITMNGGLTTITLTVDVLMSFKNEIRLLQAILEKQENSNNNPYINEGYVIDQRPNMDKIPFQNNFCDGEYILITVKGGES